MKSSPIDKETLLREIRTAVRAAGGKRIGMTKFLAVSSVRRCDIYRYYPGWRHALRAAGLDPTTHNSPVFSTRLLTDWASVAARLQRLPTFHEYKLRGGKHGTSTFTRRFGSWGAVPEAFRAFAAKNPRWKPLLKKLTPLLGKVRRRTPVREICKHAPRIPDRPACGPHLDFGPMSHAPVNEFGVIFLFALLAGRLGFKIEGFQATFPDCAAKRRIGADIWQNVTIEFEHESRNFCVHRHPIDGCDIIVCWTHNWPDCPGTLKVIALDEEVKRFSIPKVNENANG